MLFFFSSRRRHTRYWRDWSSDVCSSDLYILDRLQTVDYPISASLFARESKVSRQVIVNDIAILRAAGWEIESTNRGYIIDTDDGLFKEVVKVSHDVRRTREELYIIVDGGAKDRKSVV